MKKLYTLLLVAILATTAAFAVQTTPTISKQCSFTATVLCVPTISCTGDASLGNFLPNMVTPISGIDPLDWKINGDALLTYNITVSNAASYFATNTTVNATGGSSVLTGNWSFLAGDGETDDFVTPTTWKADHSNVGDDLNPNFTDITCGNAGLHVYFTPTSISTDGPSSTTVETFNLTVSVSAQF